MFYKSKKSASESEAKVRGVSKRNLKAANERVRYQGASRKTVKPSRMSTRIVKNTARVIVGSVACCTVVFAIYTLELHKKWESFYQRPIDNVQIEGSFQYLTQDEVHKAVEPALTQAFFDLELLEIKSMIEQNPWVDTASVGKVWPATLTITVNEQQPIARWGASGFMNMRGDIIQIDDNSDLRALPLLSGDDQYAGQIMRHYLRMGKALSQVGLYLESLELDPTGAWTLTVNDGRVIKLGRDQVWEKLQSLTTAKRTVLADKFEDVAQVDLRYHNGLAVQWKTTLAESAVVRN